jgi:hypothetical protein
MNAPTSTPGLDLLRAPPDFSLVLGGPLFQLMRRAGLSDHALGLARRRILVLSLLAWLPLLVLCALEGHLWGGTLAVPFLKDIEVHAKLLVVLPLLILAELAVHRRIRPLPQRFLDRKLIPESALPQFEAAIASALRLRNSVIAEVLLLGFVYGVGVLVIWRQYITLGTSTWYATPSAGGPDPWWAGIWYGCVSMPLFQFLLCRWYFRLFVWARFLWQVSRIRLRLVPTHPDRVGGLSFLSETSIAFIVNTTLLNRTTLLLAVAASLLALPAQPAAAQTVAEQIESARGSVKADRKTAIAEAMQLTEAEGNAFWPLYQDYRAEMDKLGDGIVKLVMEYADAYPNVPEDRAGKLLKDYLALEKDLVSTRTKHMNKIAKLLPKSKVLRFTHPSRRNHEVWTNLRSSRALKMVPRKPTRAG